MTQELSFAAALAELGEVTDALDQQSIADACAQIAAARRVVLYGCGREGLQLRGFAMRLFHLGRAAAMQGDLNAPPISAGDLFLCSSGPGGLVTVTALMRRAREAGAQVLLLSAEPDCDAAKLADRLLLVPAQTMARDRNVQGSVLPMGSLYEGALFLLFEVMALRLRELLGESEQSMSARHTNLE